MKFSDYLSVFSVPDLREMAERRGIRVTDAILKNRQTLVRTLAGALERYDSVYSTLSGLNRAEVETLRALLKPGKRPGLTSLSETLGLEPAELRGVLDGLRLWGLVFPEGNWDHLVVPSQTQMAQHYLPPAGKHVGDLRPPVLALVERRDDARPGSFDWDLAEFLARVSRARMKLTQAGRMNRRDLKGMEPAFRIETAGYPVFLSILAGNVGLIRAQADGMLGINRETDDLIGQPAEMRSRVFSMGWVAMRGYAENVAADPAEYEYVPPHLTLQRGKLLSFVGQLPWGKSVTVESLYQRLVWEAPMSFQQWDASRDPALVAARMLRSLYWLGILAVDDPERPKHAALTPLGTHALGEAHDQVPPLVPEDARFFLQPNAEIFAPPNLAPRTLLHLRRITGEKKGAPAGVYPLTADSVRRALDSGVRLDEMLLFLESFSRTGLPSNVRALVETTGRQHGRIRLVPASYVVVADTPELMEELRRLKTIQPILGAEITERAVAVTAQQVTELMRNLRTRGYAPVNEAEVIEGPDMPDNPDELPPPLDFPAAGGPGLLLSEADEVEEELSPAEELAAMLAGGGYAAEEEWEQPAVGVTVADWEEMYDLLDYAFETGELLEAQLAGGSPAGEPPIFRFCPTDFTSRSFLAVGFPSRKQHRIQFTRLQWVRRTGETFPE